MNCSANTPVQLSFFSESLNTISCSANDRARSQAAEAMDQLIRDRGWKKGEGYEYVSTMAKVPLICAKGHQLGMSPNQFKGGDGCRKCSGLCPEQARDKFEQLIAERGFRRTSGYEYVNSKAKVLLICHNGHQFEMTPRAFKGGQGCPKCAGLCPEQARDDFEQSIAERGFQKAPGYKYVNNRTRVLLRCPDGHQFEASPKDFKKGHGCPKCSGRCPEQARENFERLVAERSFREGSGYKYLNNSSKVSLICPNGHQFETKPKAFKKGHGCPKCSGRCPEQARENFERLIPERGFRKSSEYKYVDNATKVSLICPNGHCVGVNPKDFKNGDGCLKCSGRCPDQARENFEQLIAEQGYSKGEDFVYVNYKTRVPLICPNGHQFKVNPSSFKWGKGCPGCSVRASGFNQCIPATLYYVVFYPWPSRAVYKIGITNRSAEERYRYCKTSHRILMEKHFESGRDCFNEEMALIRKHKKHRCKDAPVDGIGNKELFGIDVLGLDAKL